jgi:hypothetical protein
LIIFYYKFDQVLDVMLHTVSPPRGEAASPPSPPQLHSQNAVTFRILQFQTQSQDTVLAYFQSGRLVFGGRGGCCRGWLSSVDFYSFQGYGRLVGLQYSSLEECASTWVAYLVNALARDSKSYVEWVRIFHRSVDNGEV